ncbi:Ig-like domain-containing protein, partial [Acinetobacter sp. ANC 3832]|uniref:Ig-like domain-containing protein n=1 Tax=Acinetobacter sp. ANC 3832 TaxID=1977874 RepID=UPI000B641E08
LNPYPTSDITGGVGDEDTDITGNIGGKDSGNTSDPSKDVIYEVTEQPKHGTVEVNPDGSYTYKPNPDYNGEDKFTVTITDKDGATTVVEIPVTIDPVNDDPTAVDDVAIAQEGQPFTSTESVLKNDTDKDWALQPEGEKDQLTVTTGAVTTTGGGTITFNPDGSYTYTPAEGFSGTDTVKYEISDGQGGTATGTLTIKVNPKPIAENDELVVKDLSSTGNILSNDSDKDENGADKKSELKIIINGQEVPVGENGYTFTTAQGGTVTVKADGSYIYTRPNTDKAKQWTSDSFTYQVKDGSGLLSDSATVDIKLNPYPTSDITGGVGDEDTDITGNIGGKDSGNTSDPSKDVIYEVTEQPKHGTVEVNPDGSYTYKPNPDYNGEDKFTVTITDKDGATTVVEIPVTINPVDDPLEADLDQPLITDSGKSVTSFIAVKDVDGDDLTFKFNTAGSKHIITEGGAIQTVALKDDAGQDIGTLILDTKTGVYTFTPDANYKGDGFNGKVQDFFNVTVSDGVNTANDLIVKVDIWVNDKPVFVEGSEIILNTFDEDTYDKDSPLTGKVTGKDEDNFATELTYSVSKQPTQGRVEVDPKTGEYKFYPNDNANGAYEFTIKVSDPRGLSSEIVIKGEITPVDDPLTAEADQPIAIQENETQTGKIEVMDVDGDTLTYTVKGLTPVTGEDNTFTTPKGGKVTVDPNTGDYTYTPPKDYYGDDDSFTVSVSDGHGSTVDVTVKVDINEAPTLTAEDTVTNANTSVTGTYTGADRDGDTLNYSVSEPPKNGTVVLNTDGTYTYTPNEGFDGPDNFVITVSDGKGGTTTTEVNVKVNALPEVELAVGFDELHVTEDKPLTIKIDDLIKISDKETNAEDILIDIANQPSNGTVRYDEASKSFIYTPNKDYFGKDNFVIRVKDEHGGIVEVIIPVEVAPVNDAPIGEDDERNTTEGQAVYGEVVATDVDSNKFTFKPADVKNITENDGRYITVTTDKGVLKLDTLTGKYSYKPKAGAHGEDVIQIIVTDDEGANSLPDTLNITINIDYLLTASAEAKTTKENVAIDGTVDGRQLDDISYNYTEKTGPAHGSIVLDPLTGKYTYTPDADFYGQDSFVVTVTDRDNPGKTIDVVVNITVTAAGVTGGEDIKDGTEIPDDSPVDPDKKPTYELDPNNPGQGTVVVDPDTGDYTYTPKPGAEDQGDDFTIIVKDTDGNESKIDITIAPTVKDETEEDTAITDGQIDFNGGTFSSVTNPSYGKVTVDADGKYQYTPNENFNGKDSFYVTVKNADGSITKIPVLIDVTPVNDAPDVVNETIETNTDVMVSGQLKATDVDGDKLTYSFNDPSKGGVLETEFTTENGGKLVIDSVTGQYTYTPPTMDTESTSVTVYVNDGQGGVTPLVIDIHVTGVPDAVAELITVDEDNSILDISTYIKLNGAIADDFVIKTQPKNGTLTQVDGKWVYTPNANYFGKDNFIVEVSDGKGGTIKVMVPVEVNSINDLPVGHDSSITVLEDRSYKGNVTASDVDSNRLTFSAGTAPKHGTVTVNADGTYVYKPSENYSGADEFTITVTDEQDGSSSIKVTVNVLEVNDAPEVEVIKNVEAVEEASISFKLSDHLKVTDIDTPLEQLIYSVSAGHGVVSIDKNGNITYTGNKDYFGVDKITVTINDGQGGITKVDLPVHVENVNDVPTATQPVINNTVMQSGSVTGSLGVTDVDGDILNYPSTVTSKNGLTVKIDKDGNYNYEPGTSYKYQSDSFVVTVNDGHGGSVEVTVNMAIEPKPLEQSTAKMSTFMTDDLVDDILINDQLMKTKSVQTSDIIFNVLNDDNLGGHLTTTENDFIVGSAQKINLSHLLDSTATTLNIHDYLDVQYDESTQTATLTIDRDGQGTHYQTENLLLLTQQNTKFDLDELLKNNQIIF